jgi:hypothetical protein
MVRWLIMVCVGCGYAPDSFRSRHEFPGVRQTVGCLDIAVHGQRDVVTSNPLLEVNIGNRCDYGVDVDLAALRVRGRTATSDVALVPVDPRGEIRALRMDGRLVGREVIEYRGSDGAPIGALCVDVSRVNRTAPGQQRWTCAGLDGVR